MESKTTRPEQGGVPGAATNANVTSNRATSLEAAEVATVDQSERENSSVAGTQYENSRLASLQVQRVRVSIGLPESYYQKIWTQRKLRDQPDAKSDALPLPSIAEMQQLKDESKSKIQSAVAQVLPSVAAGEDSAPLVEVWDYPDFPEPSSPQPETAQLALTWLAQHWQSVALLSLAALALLVALAAAKKGVQGVPSDFNEGFGLELPAPPTLQADAEDQGDSMTITGGSLKDELVTLVEANPEVAANVIRGWIGEAA